VSEAARGPIILAKGVSRTYPMGGGEVVGISGVDLEISEGELVVLKGESGSGKTTLLALLGGLDRPTGGSLTVAGRDLARATRDDLTRYRRDTVGMVFQSFNLLPTLTVFENARLPALLAGRAPGEAGERALELLRWMNLESRFHHLPAQLSGGEMQRTAIARSLINDPAIVLADEPTGNLDSRNGEAVIGLLARLNREFGRTVVIATHSRIADPAATRIVLLEDGAIKGNRCVG
jgi:ABC-type lipoprotein export system ATPase subunit